MRCFFDPRQLVHAPLKELHNGGFVDFAEQPVRAEAIARALGALETPADHGDAAIRAVHDLGYLDFLQDRAGALGGGGAAGRRDRLYLADRRPTGAEARPDRRTRGPLQPRCVHPADVRDLGRRLLERAIGPVGARCGAQRRPRRLRALPSALAIMPAPTISAAIATSTPPPSPPRQRAMPGRAGVAILDIDYHHGNGTQDIFWTRGDVFYASIHADPATDYPFFWGHADEVGEEGGRAPRSTCRCRRALDSTLSARRRRPRSMRSSASPPTCWSSASAPTRGKAIRSPSSGSRPPTMPCSAATSPRAAGRR